MGELRNAYRIFVRIPQSTRPFGKHRSRWKEIINWLLDKVCEGVEWIKVAQDCSQCCALVRDNSFSGCLTDKISR